MKTSPTAALLGALALLVLATRVASASQNTALLKQGFGDLDGVQVTEGEAVLSLVQQWRQDTTALVLADPVGRDVVVTLGRSFQVEPDRTYLLRGWLQPDRMKSWHAKLRVKWLDQDGAVIGDSATPEIYTASSRPHTWRPQAPVWMEYTVAARAPRTATHGRVVIRHYSGDTILNSRSSCVSGRACTSSGTVLGAIRARL